MGDFLHSLNPGPSAKGLFGVIFGGGKLKYASVSPVGKASVVARPRVKLRRRERTDNIGCLYTGSSVGNRWGNWLIFVPVYLAVEK